MKFLSKIVLVFSLIFTTTLAGAQTMNTQNLDKENTLYMDLDYGRVVIKLEPEIAPKTVARIKELN